MKTVVVARSTGTGTTTAPVALNAATVAAASTMEAATTSTEVQVRLLTFDCFSNCSSSPILGYNNDYKPSYNNGRGGFHKRNDYRNDRNGDDRNMQSGGGFYRAKPDYQNDDYGNRGGGYRSVSKVGFVILETKG